MPKPKIQPVDFVNSGQPRLMLVAIIEEARTMREACLERAGGSLESSWGVMARGLERIILMTRSIALSPTLDVDLRKRE